MIRMMVAMLLSGGLLLQAEPASMCYSVQLAGTYASFDDTVRSYLHTVSPDCRATQADNMLTLECGCFDTAEEADVLEKELAAQFTTLRIGTTHRERSESETEAAREEAPAETGSALGREELERMDDETLTVMFQAFSYRNHLDAAHKVATIAVERHPESLEWRRKLAQVCEWSGKNDEAMHHYRYIYEQTREPELRDKLIGHAINTYQFEQAAVLIREKLQSSPDDQTIKDMLYIFNQVGNLDEATQLIRQLYEKDPKPWYVEEMLQIYLNLGDLEQAATMVQELENRHIITPRTVSLRAYYYFIEREPRRAFDALMDAEHLADANATEYHRQLSDLGWHLQEYKASAKSAKTLIDTNQAKQVDYERVIYLYLDSDPVLAQTTAWQAYDTYRKPHLFYIFAHEALQHQRFDAVRDAVRIVDARRDPELLESYRYWLIKSEMHHHFHESQDAVNALDNARMLAPENTDVLNTMLWFHMAGHHRGDALEALVSDIEERAVDRQLYLPMASAHYHLEHADRALAYITELLKMQPDNLDALFLYANIKQMQNEPQAVSGTLNRIVAILEARMAENPDLKEDPDVMEQYLTAVQHDSNPDRYETMLENARELLGEVRYKNLLLMWSLRNGADEQARMIMRSFERPEPWMQLNMALNRDDRVAMQRLLEQETDLPIRERVQAARRCGDIALAQTMAFEALENNRRDEPLFLLKRELDETYADRMEFEAADTSRKALDFDRIMLDAAYGVGSGYRATFKTYRMEFGSFDRKLLLQVPSNDTDVNIGVEKAGDRSEWALDIGYRKAMERYLYVGLHGGYRFSSRLQGTLDVTLNCRADETIYLELGGRKNSIAAQLRYGLLPSTQMAATLAYDDYTSQDDVSLGSGTRGYFEVNHKLHSGYPSLNIKTFYGFGNYDAEHGAKGVIDALLPGTIRVLPDNFWNVGVGLLIGNENRDTLVKVWRPYAEITPFYDGLTHSFAGNFGVGIGGMVFGGDHLRIGMDYGYSTYGVDEYIRRIALNYTWLF